MFSSFLSQTKSNGKSLLKPWNILRKDLPKDVKDVLAQTEKGVQIAPPPQASTAAMPNSPVPGQPMPGQFPGQTGGMQPNGLPSPMMSGPSMSGDLSASVPGLSSLTGLQPGQDASLMQAQPDPNNPGIPGMPPPQGMMPGSSNNVLPFQAPGAMAA